MDAELKNVPGDITKDGFDVSRLIIERPLTPEAEPRWLPSGRVIDVMPPVTPQRFTERCDALVRDLPAVAKNGPAPGAAAAQAAGG